VEIHSPQIEVVVPVSFVSPIEIDKPLGHSEKELETLFEHRPLSLRNFFEADIFKIQDEIQVLIRE
jgi:aspartyl/asparaginyl-tRNA synthetase